MSDAKLTFCAQCAIIVGPVPFNKITRQRILQSTTTNSIKHDNKNNWYNMVTCIGGIGVVSVVYVVVLDFRRPRVAHSYVVFKEASEGEE